MHSWSKSVCIAALGGVVLAGGCGGGPVEMVDSGMPPVDAAMPPRVDAAMPPGTDAAMPPGMDAGMDAAVPMDDAAVEPADAPTGDAPPPEACTTPGTSETVACGMCGTRTRFCTSGLVWETSMCTGERGVCMAGTMMDVPCGPGGTVTSRCNAMCTWEAAGECSSPLWSCAMPLAAMAREGTTTVSSDTSAGGAGPLDLGPMCGGAIADPTMRPPQVVVSYVVPGTGMRSIQITTATPGTPADFDTLIQVRRGDCTMAPVVRDGTCFDDGVPPVMPPPAIAEYRTFGTFTATGGETLYFVVTGFGAMPTMGHVNEGPFQLDITVGDLTPPTLTAATVETVTGAVGPGDTARVTVTGGDASGDATGVVVTLLDAAGTALDTNGDGTVNAADDLRILFDLPGAAGMMTFTQTASSFALLDGINRTSAARARVRVYDAVSSESAALTVAITGVRQVGFGAVCDATHVCAPTLTCTAGICAASAEVLAACAAATPITLAGTPATASVTGMLPMGAAILPRPPLCAGSGGHVLYTVTVPAGAFDLVASTVNAATATTLDTVVYALSTCANATGGPAGACVDDLLPERRATLVVQNVAAGTYTVAVASFTTLAAPEPFGLDVTLRPVLSTGATCDPMGIANRCSAGACPAGAVCP